MLILLNLLTLPIFAMAYIILNHLFVTWLMENYKYTSKRASKKLHSTLKIIPIWKINIYTFAQIFGLYIFYENSVKNPGDVYSLAVNVTLYALFVVFILINIITSYFPRYTEKIQSTGVFWTFTYILFLYICSGAGSEWLTHIFPFSPSSIKYASAAATFIVSSSILGVLFLLTALALEFFILIYAALPTAKKHKSTNNIFVVLFFIALIASTLSLGIYAPNYAKNNFSTILISRIAFDLDSISTQLCLTPAELDEIKKASDPLGIYSFVVIQLPTSAEKGYLLKALTKLPTEIKLHNYTSEDQEKYTPKFIKHVSCEKNPSILEKLTESK